MFGCFVSRLFDYMTYDEIQISSLVSTSIPTYFINAGSRMNGGCTTPDNTHETEGVYVAAVGARFERPEFMESQHIIINETYNTKVIHRL